MTRILFQAALVFLTVSSAALAEQSCREAVGAQRSREMVEQCIDVSPATHPPCNATNPCELIIGEINRSCAMLTGSDRPRFCDQYR